MRKFLKQSVMSLASLITACRPPAAAEEKVTVVAHTPVKRQSIGNCWLYAQATWLESLLKFTRGQDINVSETYLTYWDFYEKLQENTSIPEDDMNTSGSWQRAAMLLRKYGWVEESAFIAAENEPIMSKAQECAEQYILQQAQPGGALFDAGLRTPELIRDVLDKGFSCNGTLHFNMDESFAGRNKAEDTLLKDVKTGEEASLASWLNRWKEVSSPSYTTWGAFEGKKLGSEAELAAFKRLEQRLKQALNDHQPVIMSFFVSFNAPDAEGLFNLNTLARAGALGDTGGHMVVLTDYTVKGKAHDLGFASLGEGDLAPELKEAALLGDLDYVVVKNSWGYDRSDRPWLKNGYSRITWDYLQNRYYDDKRGSFLPFLRSLILPPGY